MLTPFDSFDRPLDVMLISPHMPKGVSAKSTVYSKVQEWHYKIDGVNALDNTIIP